MEYNEDTRPLICIDSDIPYIQGRMREHVREKFLSQEEFTPENVRMADGMIIRTRTRCGNELLQGSRVKVIATATIGMDQFNIPECQQLGITTRNAPGCNAPAVAQYVWACILHLGYNPQGLTVGVIGHGHVGSIVADWGRRLGARMLISDPPRQQAGLATPEYVPLQQLLQQSDVVTVHTPLTHNGPYSTYHLISKEEVAQMRPGALFINAARGSVSSDEALIPALQCGKIHAAIDCWEKEPHPDAEMLRLVEIGTYHIAGYSRQGKQRATRMALSTIGEYFGFTPDLTGLEGDYQEPSLLTPEKIMAGIDPFALTAELRADPTHFDKLRAAYPLREETK